MTPRQAGAIEFASGSLMMLALLWAGTPPIPVLSILYVTLLCVALAAYTIVAGALIVNGAVTLWNGSKHRRKLEIEIRFR